MKPFFLLILFTLSLIMVPFNTIRFFVMEMKAIIFILFIGEDAIDNYADEKIEQGERLKKAVQDFKALI